MVVIEQRVFGWSDKLAFFPSRDELIQLVTELGLRELIRVRQTSAELPQYLQRKVIKQWHSYTSIIDLSRDVESIWHSLDPKSCRYEIHKAEKMQSSFQIAMNAPPKDFVKIYNAFVRRHGHTTPITTKRIHQYLAHSDVFMLYMSSKPVVGHLLLRDEATSRVRLIFSASIRLEGQKWARITAPLNRYLHWREFQYYKQQGFLSYDLGGIRDGASGSDKFKLSFGGNCIEENNYIIGGALANIPYIVYSYIEQLNIFARRVGGRFKLLEL